MSTLKSDLFGSCAFEFCMPPFTFILVPVVRRLDNVIRWINLYLNGGWHFDDILLSLICWIVIYPLDSVICPLYNWTLVWNKGELEYLHTFHISHNCFFFQCLLWIVSVTWRLLTIKMKGKTRHFNQTSVVFKWIIRMLQWIYIYTRV